MPELRITSASAYVEGREAATLWLTASGIYVEERLPPEMWVTAVGAYVELARPEPDLPPYGFRYTGRLLDVQWTTATGAINLSGSFRTFNTSEMIGAAEATAGGDVHRSHIPRLRDTVASLEVLDETGGLGGSAAWEMTAPQTAGTLTWSPQGTAPRKPRHVAPAFIARRTRSFPFDDVVTVNFDFHIQDVPTDETW
jgi:hypothetical protein